MDKLKLYLIHLGNCQGIDKVEPDDQRCICGLRQFWVKIKQDCDNYPRDKRLIEIIKHIKRVKTYGIDTLPGKENLNRALELVEGL